jgi:hypothetical protein
MRIRHFSNVDDVRENVQFVGLLLRVRCEDELWSAQSGIPSSR